MGLEVVTNVLFLSANSSEELNVALDLNFGRGEKLCFITHGQGVVHLTGYFRP